MEYTQDQNGWNEVQPVVWKPESPGDAISGVLLQKKENVGDNNSRAYYLENKEGMHMIWGTTVLDNRMEFCKVGEEIRITYKELSKNKKGQDLKIYKVEKRQEEQELMANFGGFEPTETPKI